jgi:hypothetical protein
MDGLMGLFVLVGTLRPAGPVQSARAFLQPAPARAWERCTRTCRAWERGRHSPAPLLA